MFVKSNNTYETNDRECCLPPWCSSRKKHIRSPSRIPFQNLHRLANVESLIHKRHIITELKRKGKMKCHERNRPTRDGCTRTINTSIYIFLLFAMFSVTLIFIVSNIITPLTVPGECKSRISQMAAALSRAEHALKKNTKNNAHWLFNSNWDLGERCQRPLIRLDEDAQISIGADTKEWSGGRATLWGVVPLWSTTPSLYTVLATRRPTPGDCWPFSGTRGEVIIELSQYLQIRKLGVEHVRPDSARSAPRHFSFYGILDNGTWSRSLLGEYFRGGPSKQLFKVVEQHTSFKQVAFRVLSNQGNRKYTCLYRIHIYGEFMSS